MTELKLSRTDVCKRLEMSVDTFDRWTKRGRLEVFRDGTLTNAKKQVVWATLEAIGKALGITDENKLRIRLGLPDLSTERLNAAMRGENIPAEPPEAPCADTPELPLLTQREEMDREFARRFLAGEVPDSFGNFFNGGNSQYSKPCTMLGPVEPAPPAPLQSHMNPALLSDHGWDGISADSPDHPLNRGRFEEPKPKATNQKDRTRQIGLSRALLIRNI